MSKKFRERIQVFVSFILPVGLIILGVYALIMGLTALILKPTSWIMGLLPSYISLPIAGLIFLFLAIRARRKIKKTDSEMIYRK